MQSDVGLEGVGVGEEAAGGGGEFAEEAAVEGA